MGQFPILILAPQIEIADNDTMDFHAKKWVLQIAVLVAAVACSSNNETALRESARAEMNSPALAVSGTSTNEIGITQYIFANAAGNVTASANEITATFEDPFLPLTMSGTNAFSGVVTTGSCTVLSPFVTSLQGTPANEAVTEMSATGCSDQAVVTMSFNSSDFSDSTGALGSSVSKINLTVDVAPKVSVVATGNGDANGTGTTEGSSLYFTLPATGVTGDASLIMTFSKAVTTLTATLTGCSATLGTGVYVGATHTVVAWPLGTLTNLTTASTCVLNVGEVRDNAGNSNDPTDPHLSMTITFH